MTATMNRILVVTYNFLNGIRSGRYAVGRLILYTGFRYYDDQVLPDEDLVSAEKAYIYLGIENMKTIGTLIEKMRAANPKIEICIFACDCGWKEKEKIAEKYGLQLEMTCCGGYSYCGRLIREYSH